MIYTLCSVFKLKIPIMPHTLDTKNEKKEPLHQPIMTAGHMEMLLSPPSTPKKESNLIAILQKIPFFSGVLKCFHETGGAIANLIKVSGDLSTTVVNACNGFQYTGLVLAAINFLRIPLVYLAMYLAKEKPPIKLSKLGRWLYSTVTVGLIISAIAIPGAGLALALAGASLGVAISIATLAKIFYARAKTRKKLHEVETQLALETNELQTLKNEMQRLEQQLTESKATGASESYLLKIHHQMSTISEKFSALYQEKQQTIQMLSDQKAALTEKLTRLGTETVVKRSLALSFAALTLAATIVSVFFPVIGAIALLSVAATAVALLIGMILYDHIKNKISLPTHHKTAEPVITNSTVKTMGLIVDEKPARHQLQQEMTEGKWLEQMNNALTNSVKHHNQPEVVVFFSQLTHFIANHEPPISSIDFRHLLEHFDEWDSGLELLKKALSSLTIKPNTQDCLLRCAVLQPYLQQHHIDLHTYFPAEAFESIHDDTNYPLSSSHQTK